MERTYANPFKMGKKQREVVLLMCEHDYRICRYDNLSNGRTSYELVDEDGNIHMDLSHDFVESLVKRKLFHWTSYHPSIDIYVQRWRMKDKLIEETILILK